MSRLDYGTVEIVTPEETYTLKPTLKALMKIEARWGGLRQAVEAAASITLDSACFIIAAGANLDKDATEKMRENVFEAGILKVMPKVVEYINLLMNPTGKDIDESSEPGE